MTKYDVYPFPNGRVAMIDSEIINEAIEAGKEVLVVCNAWSGGYAHAIGADKDTYDGKPCYMMYGYEVKEQEFTTEDLSKFYRVIFTPGEMIYMETGDQANSYVGGAFTDWNTSPKRINEYHHKYGWNDALFTEEEIFKKRKTINECATVRHIYNDEKAKVQALIDSGILSADAMQYI